MGALAVVGHTARDLVDASPPRPGGVPLYAARALAALGEDAIVVTRCAEADRDLLAPLEATGLRIVWRAEATTPVFRLHNVGDRREIEIEALGEPWTAGDARSWLGEAVREADHVYAGPLWRGDFEPEALEVLARERRLVYDGQGLVRPGRLGPVARDADVDLRVLRRVAILHLSASEAGALGLTLEAESLETLGVPEVIVTLGSQGSVVYAAGLAEHVQAIRAPITDATGAGDTFTAAYVVWRRRGVSPFEAGRRATELVAQLLGEPERDP